MKLKQIALITNNDQLASFFEMEISLCSWEIHRFYAVSEIKEEYNCMIIDNDTVPYENYRYLCPIINISSHFNEVIALKDSYTLPWPAPISAIGDLLRYVEHQNAQAVVTEMGNQYNSGIVYLIGVNTVMIDNLCVKLTPSEFAVLDLLCSASGEIVAREFISQLLGADEGNITDVYICRLRKKLEIPLGKKFIFAIRGKGYRTNLLIKK